LQSKFFFIKFLHLSSSLSVLLFKDISILLQSDKFTLKLLPIIHIFLSLFEHLDHAFNALSYIFLFIGSKIPRVWETKWHYMNWNSLYSLFKLIILILILSSEITHTVFHIMITHHDWISIFIKCMQILGKVLLIVSYLRGNRVLYLIS